MKEQINLFQPLLLEGSVQTGAPRRKGATAVLIGSILLLSGGLYFQNEKRLILLKGEVDGILRQREALQQQVAALTSSGATKEPPPPEEKPSLTPRMILKERIVWSKVLMEVSRIVPEGAWMTTFDHNTTGGIRFDGFAVSQQKVTDLIASLEQSPLFQDVTLDFSRQNSTEGATENMIDFSIQTRLRETVRADEVKNE